MYKVLLHGVAAWVADAEVSRLGLWEAASKHVALPVAVGLARSSARFLRPGRLLHPSRTALASAVKTFIMIDDRFGATDWHPMSYDNSIAFLGPAGTYSNEAALRFAARLGIEEPRLVECTSFDEVFDCVDDGVTRFGVVGKENSLEGPVTATLDNFAFRTDAVILAEEVINVSHCLVAHPDAELDTIVRVASHPQGIAQCRRFLATELPGRTTLAVSSTAESARLAAADPTCAGISNALAAELHGAKVLCRNIQDNPENQTAFALVGRLSDAELISGDRHKTSLALFLRADKPGALQMILSEFTYAGINLTMLQSRPTKKQLGDYMFFVELDGSIHDFDVQTALDCLRLKLREVKVLGSYPVE